VTCRDAIDVIADFLDQTLSPDAVRHFEEHLRDCEACRAYLNTYRTTRAMAGRAGRVAMPLELERRLRRFLIEQLDQPLR
jgi:predicted anti-sigma-YlaC factor YlaD